MAPAVERPDQEARRPPEDGRPERSTDWPVAASSGPRAQARLGGASRGRRLAQDRRIPATGACQPVTGDPPDRGEAGGRDYSHLESDSTSRDTGGVPVANAIVPTESRRVAGFPAHWVNPGWATGPG